MTGGFAKEQVNSLVIYDVYTIDGVEQEPVIREDIDMSKINYNGLTPASVYSEDRTNFTYDHDVQVYYDDLALVDKDGNPLYITAYIGVKGDVDFNNVADGTDATLTLQYYTLIMSGQGGTDVDPLEVQLSKSDLVTGPNEPLEHLAAFLADVDTNEWDPDNWRVRKEDRTIDGTDATNILKFYTLMMSGVPGQPDPVAYDVWNEVVPDRFGGQEN